MDQVHSIFEPEMPLRAGSARTAPALICCWALTALLAGGQTPTPPEKVLDSYWKMDAQGQRLTRDGWYRASRYFLKPAPPPKKMIVWVMQGGVVDVGPYPRHGATVEIGVTCALLGQLDWTGKFHSVIYPDLDDDLRLVPEKGNAVLPGPATEVRYYSLVLTTKHWEFEKDGVSLREVQGPPERRLAHSEVRPWISLDTAVRHLNRLIANSKDPMVVANAKRSIVALERLRRRPANPNRP